MKSSLRGHPALRSIGLLGAFLPALTLIAALAPGVAVHAQVGVDECAGKASQAEEIACLRRALAASRGTGTPRQTAAKPASVPQAAAPAAPRREERVAEKPRQAPAPAPRPAAQAAVAAKMGAEQLAGPHRKDPEANPAMQAIVVASEEDHEGLLMLHLDSGQRWKQTERPSLQIIVKKGNSYPVEISRSGFGGYRMYFRDMRRTIVVKRIS